MITCMFRCSGSRAGPLQKISVSWQRLRPPSALNAISAIFKSFHGTCSFGAEMKYFQRLRHYNDTDRT